MKKYLYLEPDEKIDSIINKVKKEKGKNINLVVPANSELFESKNIKIFKEKTDSLKKKIVIHSNNQEGIQLVHKNGLEVNNPPAETKQTTTKKDISKSGQEKSSKSIKIVYKKPTKKAPPPKKAKSAAQKDNKKEPTTKEPTTISQIIFAAISVVSIIIIILVMLYVLPQTTIAVTTQSNKIPLENNITFDTGQENVDFINNILPAQLINIEEEIVHEERATGEINEGEKARGTITVYNKSGSALPLVGNTRFSTSNGIVFRSTNSVNVPSGGSANVSVVADQIGEEGNIGPSHFTLPALPGTGSIIYGESASAMTGGTNQITYVISEADLQFSTDEVKEKLYEQATADIEDKLPQDRKYIAPDIDSITISTEANHQVGDQIDTFTITAKASYPFLVYEEKDLQELIEQNLSKLVSQDRSIVSEESQEYSLIISGYDSQTGQATADITTQAVTTPTYNVDLMKKDLAGMSREEVKEYFLQYPEIQQIDITFWPDWVKRVSKIPSRINIEVIWK